MHCSSEKVRRENIGCFYSYLVWTDDTDAVNKGVRAFLCDFPSLTLQLQQIANVNYKLKLDKNLWRRASHPLPSLSQPLLKYLACVMLL